MTLKPMMQKKRFSLIEILTVMIIAIAVMTVMIPSARKLVRGNRVNELASSLKLGLEQAQVQALSRRTYVAVIFPSNSSTLSDVQWKKYLLGGYRLAVVAQTVESEVLYWDFQYWLPDSEWYAPPQGANLVLVTASKPTIGNGLSDVIKSTTTSYDSPLTEIRSVPDEFAGGSSVSVQRGLIFDRYGMPYNLSNPLYLCVAGTEIDGDDITFPNQVAANSPVNYQVLELKNFSGKVNYVQE